MVPFFRDRILLGYGLKKYLLEAGFDREEAEQIVSRYRSWYEGRYRMSLPLSNLIGWLGFCNFYDEMTQFVPKRDEPPKEHNPFE